MKVKHAFYFTFLFPFVAFTFYTVYMFGRFLSSQSCLRYPLWKADVPDQPSNDHWTSLLTDSGLLSLFLAQHTLQAKERFRMFIAYCRLSVFERLIYNMSTCLALQILMMLWQPVHNWIVWDLTTQSNAAILWVFTILHILAWIGLYTGCLLYDLYELMGVKQIYYHLQGWSSPLEKKGKGLLRLYAHMRHPGFTTLTFISLVHPVMQIDRLLLSYTFIVFMISAFSIDEQDALYHRQQLKRKQKELQC